jgi:Zn-dependent protease with chaperone function
MRTLITAVENVVLFGSLTAIATFAIAGAARLASRRGWRPHPYLLTRLYAAAVALPPLVALWLVAAALLPEWWLGKSAFDVEHARPEHLHLLSDVTASLEPGLGLATAALALIGAVYAAVAAVRGYGRVSQLVARLDATAPPAASKVALVQEAASRHGLDVGLVLSEHPITFVWGFGRSKLLLSSGLIDALTDEELAGVLEHEAAHHTRRDNLVKLALSFSAHATLLFPLARRVLSWRAEAVELVCDEVAAARTQEPLEIAGALVKVRRFASLAPGPAPAAATAGFLPAGATGFEYRVRRLVAFADALPSPTSVVGYARGPLREAVVVTVAFAATLAAVLTIAPLAVHRAAETVITLFV